MKPVGTVLPTLESLAATERHCEDMRRRFAPLHRAARVEARLVTEQGGQIQYWISDTHYFEIGEFDGKRRNFERRNDGDYAVC